jgi:hypothetical protein
MPDSYGSPIKIFHSLWEPSEGFSRNESEGRDHVRLQEVEKWLSLRQR